MCLVNFLLRKRANARNVTYTSNLTGENIPCQLLLIKPIVNLLPNTEKLSFLKKIIFQPYAKFMVSSQPIKCLCGYLLHTKGRVSV